MEADRLLESLGPFGLFQVLFFLCVSFIYMRGAWPVMAILFLGGDPGHHCKVHISRLNVMQGSCLVVKLKARYMSQGQIQSKVHVSWSNSKQGSCFKVKWSNSKQGSYLKVKFKARFKFLVRFKARFMSQG